MASMLLWGDFGAPEGTDPNILLAAKISILVITLLMLLPSVYVGVKGLRIAKNPSPAKAHIVWAKIIFVFTVLALITPIVSIVKQGDIGANIASVSSILLEIIIYFDYIKYAQAVRRAC